MGNAALQYRRSLAPYGAHNYTGLLARQGCIQAATLPAGGQLPSSCWSKLNSQLPPPAIEEAITKLTHHDFSRSLLQHNQAFHKLIRDGVPVSYRNAQGQLSYAQAAVIDFRSATNNRFLVVRELKLTGLRTPNYNRRADLVCFVNGLPLVFIELKAVYKNIRAGFDGNLRDYMDENVVAQAFHHNAFLIVSNGHNARFGYLGTLWRMETPA
jgi:type I restriction enzyme R subunit